MSESTKYVLAWETIASVQLPDQLRTGWLARVETFSSRDVAVREFRILMRSLGIRNLRMFRSVTTVEQREIERDELAGWIDNPYI